MRKRVAPVPSICNLHELVPRVLNIMPWVVASSNPADRPKVFLRGIDFTIIDFTRSGLVSFCNGPCTLCISRHAILLLRGCLVDRFGLKPCSFDGIYGILNELAKLAFERQRQGDEDDHCRNADFCAGNIQVSPVSRGKRYAYKTYTYKGTACRVTSNLHQ